MRESPAKYIALKVLQKDNNNWGYFIVEPNIKEHKVFKLINYNEAANKVDIIVFLMGHKEFENLKIAKDKVVLDFCKGFN